MDTLALELDELLPPNTLFLTQNSTVIDTDSPARWVKYSGVSLSQCGKTSTDSDYNTVQPKHQILIYINLPMDQQNIGKISEREWAIVNILRNTCYRSNWDIFWKGVGVGHIKDIYRFRSV